MSGNGSTLEQVLATMAILSLGVRIVLCATFAVLLIKIVSDRQRFRWPPHQEPSPRDEEKCSDTVLGPEPHTDWPNWAPFADVLAEEVKQSDEGEAFDVVFYGDSITEQWRGSAVGAPYPSLKQAHEAFESYFNRNYSSLVLAIAGDQVGHLWWRMLNSEIPKKQPKVAVILIGTNDLTADDCQATEEASLEAVTGIVSRVRQMLWLLRSRSPETQIVLVGLLPRDAHVLSGPPAYEWPNRMTSAIALANFEYQSMTESDDKVHYIDCGAPYILPSGGLDSNLIPDALHPNGPGMEQMAKCLQPLIDDIVLLPTPAAVAGAAGI